MSHRLLHIDPSRWPRPVLAAAAAAAPFLICIALVPVRDDVANTNAALVLVLVIVGFAATGQRLAGVVSAISSGVCFDFFLTPPYEKLTIDQRADVETAVLLVLVGLGVSQLAAWGRRQQARASMEEGYLAGISELSEIVAGGRSLPSVVLSRICADLQRTLGAAGCRFDYGMGLGHPRLHRDGTVTLGRLRWTALDGAPPGEKPFELLAEHDGSFAGRFLIDAPEGLKLTRTQLRVATSLADEAGSVLANVAVSRA